MKVLALVALVAGALPLPASAAELLVCELRQYGGGNWIPEALFIGREVGAETAIVSDTVVLQFNAGPVGARVAADNAARTTYVWSIAVRDRGGTYAPSMLYRATYLKATGRMEISATPAGFDTRFQGGGTCQRRLR
ncbi:hypothetical protein [Roseivivax isoporae]|uniref:Uncharacterized protein n=1 Tax=Roseivivax isoporae LMG 25204 TaxID=1449351 RepID=X7FC12_9RHOB|nr:hypothetical protein [Roseivivax isoporae]ETX29559.1 hypothetical protein RISW2_23770 [Roseivivax isoporae LMG 25204]